MMAEKEKHKNITIESDKVIAASVIEDKKHVVTFKGLPFVVMNLLVGFCEQQETKPEKLEIDIWQPTD